MGQPTICEIFSMAPRNSINSPIQQRIPKLLESQGRLNLLPNLPINPTSRNIKRIKLEFPDSDLDFEAQMGTLFLKQASSFLQQKYKAARSAFTDVSDVELWTEQVTDCNPWVPDARVMAQIAKASYDYEDYWKVANVLHNRFKNVDWKKWRIAYNSLVLLDFLLTHGPEEFADEFQCDYDIIAELESFEYTDTKGFNWGVHMKNKIEKILKFLEKGPAFHEARSKAIKPTHKIQGFGSSPRPKMLRSSSALWTLLSSRSTSETDRSTSNLTNHNFKYEKIVNAPTIEDDLSRILTQWGNYDEIMDKDDIEVRLLDLTDLDDDDEDVTNEFSFKIHVNRVGCGGEAKN